MKDFNLAKEVYLNDKLKMQKQIENLENDCAKVRIMIFFIHYIKKTLNETVTLIIHEIYI